MRENTWGAYQNALPGRWLVWHGARPLRPPALRLRGAPRRPRRLPARALRHDRLSPLEAPAVPVEPASGDTDHAWFATRRGTPAASERSTRALRATCGLTRLRARGSLTEDMPVPPRLPLSVLRSPARSADPVSLEQTVAEVVWGAYLDAMPEHWLVWHGKGLYGPTRYACPDHRGDLVAFLREHYGTIGWHPWKRPPYPTTCATPTPSARSPSAPARRCRSGATARRSSSTRARNLRCAPAAVPVRSSAR